MLNFIDMAIFGDIMSESADYESKEFNDESGKEHYRLLAHFSTLFNNATIIDIGTHRGKSSLALSYNMSNTVLTFDIIDCIENSKIKTRPNIRYYLEDLWNSETRNKWTQTILSSPLIFLDVDPHNGTMEYDFYEYLRNINYRGMVLCDDIWYFKDMRDKFWYKIPDECRYDYTQYGHWSGTGLIVFGNNKKVPLSISNRRNENWTLVTAYFDLTKCPDATDDIKARDRDYYLHQYGTTTLHLPYNLVIYCDSDSYEKINKIRPEYLKERTHYVICNFEDFRMILNGLTFTEYREKIAENRRNKPYEFDNRNTPSYLLFCMCRYIILKRTIVNNPFNSTHFGWINICIERMGYKNIVYLDEALSCNRDKFSTCYINYRADWLISNLPVYFSKGYCSFCSGFFTGNGEYMYKFCDAILEKADKLIDMGYGHSDETFYPVVYCEKPEIFDVYYGGYLQMITNYKYTREDVESVIHLMVSISFEYKDYEMCIKTCEKIIESYVSGNCDLTDTEMHKLGYFLIRSKKILANKL
jgi:hypothetical protein